MAMAKVQLRRWRGEWGKDERVSVGEGGLESSVNLGRGGGIGMSTVKGDVTLTRGRRGGGGG